MSHEQLILPVAPAQVTPAPVPTFAEARARIATWTDLSETRRREMISALATVAKILGKPEAMIPCEVPRLNRHLFNEPPSVLGKNRGRFGNVVSLLRAVLRRLGMHAPEIRGDGDLPQEWRALLAVVPMDAQRSCLRAFGRYGASVGVVPSAMSDAVLEAYAAHDAATRLSEATRNTAGTVAAVWNSCVRAGLPGWPGTLLTAPRKHLPYTLPLEAYPKTFQEEVEAYRQRISGLDGTGQRRGRFVMRRTGYKKPLKADSVRTRVFAIRQAAGILVLLGKAKIEEIRSLRDLVQPVERVGAVLDWLAERHAAKHDLPENAKIAGGQIAQVAETLRQIALHHVGLTGDDLAEIQG
jgi:hypothetical protein